MERCLEPPAQERFRYGWPTGAARDDSCCRLGSLDRSHGTRNPELHAHAGRAVTNAPSGYGQFWPGYPEPYHPRSADLASPWVVRHARWCHDWNPDRRDLWLLWWLG